MPIPRRIQPGRALAHLRKSDNVMSGLIDQVGPFRLRTDSRDPFASLCRAIVFQQLAGKAAATIHHRFVDLFRTARQRKAAAASGPPDSRWALPLDVTPDPRRLLKLPEETLRGAGLSRQKVAYLRDLAVHFTSGDLSEARLHEWDDETIVEHLVRVKGIGRWSAEMFLISHLGRPDVLPVIDLGINKAIQRHYRLRKLPTPAQVRKIGAPWRPWATVACWYLWRSLDVVTPDVD